MKTFGKYLFIVLAGCAIGSVAMGLDAGYRFVPQRFIWRALGVRERATGQVWPVLEKAGALKPVRIEVERGLNLLLDPRDFVSREILIAGVWQPQVWQSISRGLSSGAVFLDVGAHIGYDSLKASPGVGQSGKVISFEPNPGTLVQLRANIAASRATNVIVEPIACADAERTLMLYDATAEGNSGASSLSLANADHAKKGALPSYTVRGRPIDNVVRELGLGRVDVVKIDVEGAEYLVLRGMRETLKRFHPKMVLEVDGKSLANMGATVEEVVSLMTEFGYGPGKQLDDEDWEWTVKQ
ncbi:MAG TPA: FkbM family methyltransferase [Bryobacteraceae bacterium]|nr:FkbM family methyltransferase [Bryobacteraceae bacterium]